MSTELMWRACSLYTSLFDFCWKYPIAFSYSEKRTNFNTTSGGVRIWKVGIIHTLIYFDLLLHTFAALAYIAAGDFVSAFLCGIDVSVSFMNILFCYLVLLYGEQVSTSINYLITLEENVRLLTVKKKRNKKPDSLGRILIALTVALGCLPYVAFLGIPLPNIPFFTVEGNGLAKVTESFLRRILFFVTHFEFARVICVTLLGIIICVQIIKRISIELKETVQIRYFRFNQHLRVYNGLIITVQQSTDFLSPVVAYLMAAGFGICVTSNLITLKFRTDTIPFPFFYFFPVFSVIAPLVINFVLSEAILCHELTNDLLAKWRCSVNSMWSNKANRKYVARRLKALRTLDFPVGIAGFHCFHIVRETKVGFYASIVDNTINAVLSVPDVQ
jgi:hypothetical protein